MSGAVAARLVLCPAAQMAHVVQLAVPLVQGVLDDSVRVFVQAVAEPPEHIEALVPLPLRERIPAIHHLYPVLHGCIAVGVFIDHHFSLCRRPGPWRGWAAPASGLARSGVS